jgi:MFS family permease
VDLTEETLSRPASAERGNVRHLFADIFWFGALAGSTQAFLNIYAARLGASAFQIGLITAGPAMLNLLFSLPAGRWLQGKSYLRVTFWAAIFNRLGYLAMVFIPWLFADYIQVRALVLTTLLMALPATAIGISFYAMFAELVPSQQRAEIVGKRNALLAVTMTTSALLSGQILERVVFPLNYQIVFALGAFGALMSAYHLGRLRMPARIVPDRPQPPPDSATHAARQLSRLLLFRNGNRPLLQVELLRGSFGHFILAYLLFYTFQYFCLPLFPLAYVHTLKLTDNFISLGNSLFYTTMFLMSLRLSRLAARYGHRKLLASSAVGFGLYPLLIYLAAYFPALYWVASLAGGFVWSTLSASLANRLMERVPDDSRPAGMALHNLALNLGILIGSLAGPFFGHQLGTQSAILVGAGLRFLAGFLLFALG